MTCPKWVLAVVLMLAASVLPGCVTIQGTASDAKLSRFSITPDKIKFSQNFSITLPVAHPTKLAIRDPRGQWYWVQDPDENILFMPDAEFRKASLITIYPAQLKGATWIDGKRVDGLVFKSPGEYLVYCADNLETEPENTFHFMGSVTVTK